MAGRAVYVKEMGAASLMASTAARSVVFKLEIVMDLYRGFKQITEKSCLGTRILGET